MRPSDGIISLLKLVERDDSMQSSYRMEMGMAMASVDVIMKDHYCHQVMGVVVVKISIEMAMKEEETHWMNGFYLLN